MARGKSILSFATVLLLAAFAANRTAYPAMGEITGQNLSASLQYAALNYADKSRGWDPVMSAQYDLGLDRLAVSAALGFGTGWSVQAKRFEGALGASYDLGPLFAGAGWRFAKTKTSNWVDEEWMYHGPELTVESGFTFEDTPVSVGLSASFMPYVFASYENMSADKQTERVWGFSLDGRVETRLMENMGVSLGYRFKQFKDKDFSTPYAGSPSVSERLHGPYVECRLYW